MSLEGIYSVTVTKDGCDRTDEIEVMHYDAPFVDLGGVLSICNGEPVLVDAFHPDASSYEWPHPYEFSSSSQSAKFITMPGDYGVTITNNNGCSAINEVSIIAANPFIDLEVSVQDCSNWETILSTTDFAGFEYLWTDRDGIILSEESSLTINSVGEYNLYVSQNGCTVTQQIVFDDTSFGATNAYTIGANGNPIEEIWTTAKSIDGMMIVASGTKLTIDGATIQFMNEQSGISVEEGGILQIINRAVLRGNSCNEEYWHGVEVSGNKNIAHDNDFWVNGNPNHGVVLINSGSAIQDATIGIQTGNGIVQAFGASFIDNKLGIQIGVLGETIWISGSDNANIIESNNFGIDSPINSSSEFMGIRIYNYFDEVNIKDNYFYNINSAQYNVQGIACANSQVHVHNNIFDDLRMGISIFDLINVFFSNNVSNNVFNNTERGVLMVFGLVPQANNNVFNDIRTGIHATDAYGIYSINSRFIINKNSFHTSLNSNQIKGLVVSHTWDNFVHVNENTFDGAFGAATQFQATNNNVLLECNAYANAPKIDWYIAENGLLNQQGDCQGIFLPAYATNNTWHPESAGYHIYKASSGNFS